MAAEYQRDTEWKQENRLGDVQNSLSVRLWVVTQNQTCPQQIFEILK